ncbi:MAG TPA: HAD-IA family hydrolase [Cellvibrionaceae bacterium]
MKVIFDCDGVLVDTEKVSAEVLQLCLQEQGVVLALEDIFNQFRGKSIAVCASQVHALLAETPEYSGYMASDLQKVAEAFWRQVQDKTLEAFARGVSVVPGIERVLQTLQTMGVEFAVASNGKHEKMQVTLGSTGLLTFFNNRLFSATDVAQGKPAPDLFLLAARTMGASAQQCMVVEDSLSGACAAHAAGMGLIAYCPEPDADFDRQMQDLGAYIIRTMDELIPTLRQQFTDLLKAGVDRDT